MPTHYCIIGPTAIGKSSYSIELAKKIDADIVSSDAFQVYKGMDIGTAKVTLQEQQAVTHHLIDILEPDEPYSVVEFIRRSKALIKTYNEKNKSLVFCGGTGFYVHALLYDYDLEGPGENKALRDALIEEKKGKRHDYLWQKLAKLDPLAAEQLELKDEKRIIRAIEYKNETGKSITTLSKKQHVRADFNVIGLKATKDVIWQNIYTRVDQMFEAGLVREVEELLAKGYSPTLKAFEAIGYKEVIQFIQGSLTEAEVIELVKLKTRQFAKRQMTWFKRIENVEWIHAG